MVRKCEPSFCKAASEKNDKILRKSCAQQTRFFHVAHWVPEPPALAKRHRHLLRKRVSARILHCNMRLRLSSALYIELRIPGYLPNSNTLLTRPSRKLLSEQLRIIAMARCSCKFPRCILWFALRLRGPVCSCVLSALWSDWPRALASSIPIS